MTAQQPGGVTARLLTFFARRLPPNLPETEDLTQLALIRIAKALCRIDPERAGGYIATVARSLLRTAYRERARDRRRYQAMSSELPSGTWVPDGQAEYEELVLAVHRAVLTRLPRPLRQVMARFLDDESQVQIAGELQLNQVTVRTRLRRARLMLRRELSHYLHLPGLHSGGKPDLREAFRDRVNPT